MPLSPVRARTPPSGFTLGWCGQLLGSFLVSPLTLWWILFYVKTQVDKRIYTCIRLFLPKPDNPDAYSIKGALEDELDNDTIPGLGFIKNSDGSATLEGTLMEELKKDVLRLFDGVWKLVNISKCEDCKEHEEEASTNFQGISLFPLQSANSLIHSAADRHSLLTIGISPRPATPRPSGHDSPLIDLQDENHDPASDNSHLPQHRLAGAVSPSHTPSSSPVPPPDPETVVPPSPTNNTPTDTLQPSNHLSNGQLSDDLSHRNNNQPQAMTEQICPQRRETSTYHRTLITTVSRFPPQKNRPIDLLPPGGPRHRVTALTAHLADAMGSHISTHLADILFFPLETLFIRSVARNFLSLPLLSSSSPLAASSLFLVPVHAPAVADRLRAEVFPLETWFGAGLRGGRSRMMDYAGRLALCTGLEVGLGYVVWQVGAGLVWWLGVKVFEWHLL